MMDDNDDQRKGDGDRDGDGDGGDGDRDGDGEGHEECKLAALDMDINPYLDNIGSPKQSKAAGGHGLKIHKHY